MTAAKVKKQEQPVAMNESEISYHIVPCIPNRRALLVSDNGHGGVRTAWSLVVGWQITLYFDGDDQVGPASTEAVLLRARIEAGPQHEQLFIDLGDDQWWGAGLSFRSMAEVMKMVRASRRPPPARPKAAP